MQALQGHYPQLLLGGFLQVEGHPFSFDVTIRVDTVLLKQASGRMRDLIAAIFASHVRIDSHLGDSR